MRCCFKIIIPFVFFVLKASAQNGIIYQWAGAVTDSTARITIQTQSASNLLNFIIDTNSAFANPITTNYLLPDTSNNNIYSTSLTSLLPNTKYYYAALDNGTIIPNSIAHFTTSKSAPMSFSFALGSCSNSGNHAVYNVIDNLHPRFFIFTGDLHYYDPNSFNINVHRTPYTITLSQPAIKNFLHHTPIAYMWDDHDFAGNNSDANAIGRHSACVAYRQCVPHYPTALHSVDDAIYFSFNYGRLHFIVSDLRSERIAQQNIMSVSQLNWLKAEMLHAKQNKQIAVWMSSVSFNGTSQIDNWAEFGAERTEIANFLRDSAIANLFMLSGDAHMLAIDNGSNNHFETGETNPYEYPIFQAAALNRGGSIKGGAFSSGVFPNPTPETGQFGVVDVIDNGGDTICITFNGYRTDSVGQNTAIITSYSFCRNIESDIISTKNLIAKNSYDITTSFSTFGFLSITNNSSNILDNVEVTDVLGKQIIMHTHLQPSETIYSSAPINSGIFILRAKSNTKYFIKKIGR
jgi:alkaline phosphatase D